MHAKKGLLMGAVVAAVIWLALGMVQNRAHHARMREAWQAFVESRPEGLRDPDSFAFEVRGVSYGDTVQQVDAKMHGSEVTPASYLPSGTGGVGDPAPPGTAFVRSYAFDYRPIRDENGEISRTFVSEFYQVFFDEQSRAFMLQRFLFIRDDPFRSGHEWLDLKTGAKGEW